MASWLNQFLAFFVGGHSTMPACRFHFVFRNRPKKGFHAGFFRNLEKELLSGVYSPRERFVHSRPKRVPAEKWSTQMCLCRGDGICDRSQEGILVFNIPFKKMQSPPTWSLHYIFVKTLPGFLNNAGFMLLMIACRTSVHLPLLEKLWWQWGLGGPVVVMGNLMPSAFHGVK